MSTKSDKSTLATGASPLDTLRSWAGGDVAPHATKDEPINCLDHKQQVRLWNLLRKSSKPGLLSGSDQPR
jgi:hypothetical protein